MTEEVECITLSDEIKWILENDKSIRDLFFSYNDDDYYISLILIEQMLEK